MLRSLLRFFLSTLVAQAASAQSIGRDANGKPTIRAIKPTEPLHVDGKLNEQVYSGDNAFSSNLRFRWEYRPGTELFVVYTDEHDTTSDVLARPGLVRGLKNRAFVVKINRRLRF